MVAAGYELAKKERLEPVFRLPPDSPLWINPLVDKIKPSALILVEAELWPALLWRCKAKGIPTILVNGRMSSKSYNRYSKLGAFFRSLADAVTAFSMRTKEDAEKVLVLGAPAEKVHVTGNVKFDVVIPNDGNPAKSTRPNETSLVVFGSTRPGDEGPILDAVKKLFVEFPHLRYVLAPRHIQRIQEVERLIRDFDLDYVKHSDIPNSPSPSLEKKLDEVKIILVDTVGDLISYYQQSIAAFVGGSFNPRFGGQNILEPAVCGQPVIYGKHMSNFEEEARLLNESGGGVQLQSPQELYPVLRNLIRNTGQRRCKGETARQAVLANRGAVEKNLILTLKVLA